MKQILITLLFFFTGFTVLAQVGIGTQTPQATLDITGNQGLLIPRMTDHTVLTPIDGTLDANEKGLQVYNTTTSTIMVWDGSLWKQMDQINVVPLWKSMTNGGVYSTDDLINYSGELYKNITGVNTNTTPDLDATNWGSTNTSVLGDKTFNTSGYIPVMTSNTQAGFVTTASRTWSARAPYRAFNQGTTNSDDWIPMLNWTAQNKGVDWVKIELPSPQRIWKVELTGRLGAAVNEYFTKGYVQGSNDNTNWDDLVYTEFTRSGSLPAECNRNIDGVNTYKYYRFTPTDKTGNNPGISGFQIFTLDETVTPSLSLRGLTDTDLTTYLPASGDILEFDGTNWVPAKIETKYGIWHTPNRSGSFNWAINNISVSGKQIEILVGDSTATPSTNVYTLNIGGDMTTPYGKITAQTRSTALNMNIVRFFWSNPVGSPIVYAFRILP